MLPNDAPPISYRTWIFAARLRLSPAETKATPPRLGPVDIARVSGQRAKSHWILKNAEADSKGKGEAWAVRANNGPRELARSESI
jgi:hypothetical protein